MKAKVYTFFFLTVLILYILRPVLPYLEYALNKEYIAKNLCVNRDKPKSCCQGKCHLKKELAKNDNSENSQGSNSSKKNQQKTIDEFLKNQSRTIEILPKVIILSVYTCSTYNKQYFSTVFVPPKFSFVISAS
jgi:ribosomal protein S19